MKSIIKVLGLLGCGVAMTLASCDNEKFLTTTQYDIVASTAAYENDENAKTSLNGVYAFMVPDRDSNHGGGGDWGFKPNLFTGCHPTMDTQATGWDKDWNVQKWNSSSTELLGGWKHAFVAISRANEFLTGLEGNAANLSPAVAKSLEGEARALRGFFYQWLATTFRKVPMLATGETYANTPYKSNDVSDAEMWDFIIDDFKNAADLLSWKPLDNQYGRCTKGMALAYLADAYMWKAYRTGDNSLYNDAKAALEQIVNSGEYALNPSFTTLWDCAGAWDPEAIWVEVLDEGTNWGQWSDRSASMFTKFYTACPENGGWGSLFLSWEWYASYESGDKRRDGSAVTGLVPADEMAAYGIEPSATNWGFHPYLNELVGSVQDGGVCWNIEDGKDKPATQTKQFHFYNGEYAPSIWSIKFWRNATADWSSLWSPTNIYWKRYANVLIDLAECYFRTGAEAQGWALLDQIRDRAWGNQEVGKAEALTAKYLAPINGLVQSYGRPALDAYPIPFNTETVSVPSAKEYYTKLAASGPTWLGNRAKAFSSPAWLVAVNMERRKEFNTEWCLRPDMQRSGFMAEHIDVNYPKGIATNDALIDIPWTSRDFDYNDAKMDMPIPQDELIKNPLCVQNEAYRNAN